MWKLNKIKSVISLFIIVGVIVAISLFRSNKQIAPTTNFSTESSKGTQINKSNKELARDWVGMDTFIDVHKGAVSPDGKYTASCRVVKGGENARFILPTEIVIKNNIDGKEKVYQNPYACPFKWSNNVLYAMGKGYESAAEMYRIELSSELTLGTTSPLGFDSFGQVDSTLRYYSFGNAIKNEGFDKNILFCSGNGSVYIGWKRSDELGYIDFQTGIITILLKDANKVYNPEGWSKGSKKILYREYPIIPSLVSTDNTYCPGLNVGKRYSIDINTKEIKREEDLDNVLIR